MTPHYDPSETICFEYIVYIATSFSAGPIVPSITGKIVFRINPHEITTFNRVWLRIACDMAK